MTKTVENIKLYIQRLSALDPDDTAGFHAAVRDGLELKVFTDEFMAHKVCASRTTIARWQNGKSAPHPAMRKGVIGLMKRQAELAIKEINTGNLNNGH